MPAAPAATRLGRRDVFGSAVKALHDLAAVTDADLRKIAAEDSPPPPPG
ncbi:hypothetical protein [Streptomyces flaveolus]